MPDRPIVHTHASSEAALVANAYLIETGNGVVAVDGALTVSESRAFRARADALGKPLLAVLVTHAHPDHVAGIAELTSGRGVPILALASVDRLARTFEGPKRVQWKPVFGEEWIDTWAFPNRIVRDGEPVTFDGVAFRVHDIGPGGDCDANSLWLMHVDSQPAAAFVGDLVFNGTHSYLADGRLLAWLANLERARDLLAGVRALYPGHGVPGSLELLASQQAYLLAYCAAVRDLADGQPALAEAAKQELVARMERYLPDAPLRFMVALGADAAAAELAGPGEIRSPR